MDGSTGRWCAVVSLGRKPDGRRERRKVTARTKAEVLAKLRLLRRGIENGLAAEPRLTVAAYLDRWSATLDGRVRPNTADQYRFTMRCHLKPALGARTLAKLTPGELDALWAAKLAAGFRPNTVRLMRATLRRALHDGERDGLVVRNVAALSTPPRVEPPDGRTLTVEQTRTLLSAVRGDRLEAAYLLVLAFGLRRAELLGLAWADLDDTACLLDVRQQVTVRKPPPASDGARVGRGAIELSALKTGSKGRRTLELTPEILKALEEQHLRQEGERARAGALWQKSGLIFTTPVGTPIEPSSFSHAFSRVAERAGLGRWHVHEARHTAASLMLAMGTKLEVVSRVLGHSSVTVTADVYSHLLGGEKRAAAAAMMAALLESE
ncbi:MAG TPA: tyrosine-type recombinase/integrase [Acidimicrobiales bacterium]|nr:tyrosine-type recombinase/integrase [Acidimicrobiales bacterium]